MKLKHERRKDPALRYLWGLIYDLESKIRDYEERQKEIERELNEIKKAKGGR